MPIEWIGIDHIQLAAPVGCEPAAREFFGGLLEMAEVPKPADLAARGGVWFQVGEQQLHVGVEEPFSPAHKAHPALRVAPAELELLAERLLAAGFPVIWDDALPDADRFHVHDPWGNRLELLSRLDSEPSGGRARKASIGNDRRLDDRMSLFGDVSDRR